MNSLMAINFNSNFLILSATNYSRSFMLNLAVTMIFIESLKVASCDKFY